MDISNVQFVDRVSIQLRMQGFIGDKFYMKRLGPGDKFPLSIGADGKAVQFVYQNEGYSEIGIFNKFQSDGTYLLFQIYTGNAKLYNYIRDMVVECAAALKSPIDAEEWNEQPTSETTAD